MSKKINKTMARKLTTRANMEKRRAKKYGHDYATFSLEDDYYATVDHFTYDDVSNLVGLPSRYNGSID